MPIYDQQCRDCGQQFEFIALSFTCDRPCPHCQSTHTDQLVSLCAFHIAARKFEVKRGAAHNPYQGLTLSHVKDEKGKPITVNSERELRAAEKKYNFVHAASWGMEKEPPQHESWAGDITRGYKRKFNHDPAAYSDPRNKSDAGVVLNNGDTLAALPNPTGSLKDRVKKGRNGR